MFINSSLVFSKCKVLCHLGITVLFCKWEILPSFWFFNSSFHFFSDTSGCFGKVLKYPKVSIFQFLTISQNIWLVFITIEFDNLSLLTSFPLPKWCTRSIQMSLVCISSFSKKQFTLSSYSSKVFFPLFYFMNP